MQFFYRKYGGIAPTFRMPTPLLPYHHVMIPGAFLTGFCLAPLLVLSRHFAQMPSHRLKVSLSKALLIRLLTVRDYRRLAAERGTVH